MSIQKKMKDLSNGNSSHWLKEADFFIENEGWLEYSGRIAMRIIAAMEEKQGMTQSKLAALVGVKVQYISKVLKGHENLSLKTIYKLSEALGVDLISFPEFKYSQPIQPKSSETKVVHFNAAKSTSKDYQLTADE